ncbi:MAG: PEP-CTERM sorting domain-containing protein, partial [Pseudomonadales bacterium]|nr:PEP-CTERM sorting domain-containing protein [Pseudomonadales bacterium]
GSHSYFHDLNDDGFELGSAVSGTLEISVTDDNDRSGELVLFTVEDFDFDSGGYSFGSAFVGGLEVNALGALNADGKLDVTVTSLWGDFYVGDSILTVYTNDDGGTNSSASTVSVPEPGVLTLLGLGVIGLGLARTRA